MSKKQWIRTFMMRHKWVFLCAFIVTTLGTMSNMIYPFLNGEIINIAFYDKDMSAFLNLAIIYIGVLLFNQFILMSFNNLISSQLMTGFVFDIRRTFFKKILRLKGKDLSGMYSGDMISRMNKDTQDFMMLIFMNGIWGYSNLLHILFAVGFMFYYNILLGVITVILVPVVFYTSRYFKNKSQHVHKSISKEQGKLSSYLFEIVKNMQEIKMLNAIKKVTRFYSRRTTSINRMLVESGKIDVTTERVNAFISLLAQLLIFTICAYFIVNGRMQLGAFVAAISYYNMAVNYFGVINGRIVDVGKRMVSIQRVVDILNEDVEDRKEDLPPKQIKHGAITFNKVTFGYNEDHPVLNGIDLQIDAGSTIGIVGKSGAGKTTMVNMLYHLYDVDDGELLVDGMNIQEYHLGSLRNQVGIVHQETILYDNTLRYNLSFTNNKDQDDTLMKAIRKAALYDVFQTLPNGLDTVLGAAGQALSGGQKQRLAIARLIVKNPKILIFDEATSFLDSQNEALIRKVIDELSKDRTLLIIAHRLSTIRSCDKIAVLADGRVNGCDTHDELMKNNEIYRSLFREQSIGGEVA